MNLEELVNQKYHLLTANDKEMLTAVFRNKQRVREMNSTQLASYLHVSRTTLVRLMKKLGIDTYKEFKVLLDMRREEALSPCSYNLQDIVSEYHLMVDELKKHRYEKICQSIYEADTVYMYGSGNEQKTIAEEFKRIFMTFGKCCVDLFDLGEVEFAAARMTEKDLLLAISLSGENKESMDVVRTVQKAGVKSISFTRWENNSLARLCQESLYVGTRTVSQSAGRTYEMVASFYILLDVLSVRYLEFVQNQERKMADESGRAVEQSL